MFESQVEQTPDNVAVNFESKQLTYQELNQRANKIAHYLQTLNVGPEVMVGICLERSLELVIGLLGILKAGGSYVPLDPAYPQERLAYMIEDSQIPVLLTQQNLLEGLPECKANVVCLDTDWETITKQSEENPDSGVTAENLAYTLYTSGSTGKPKGVQIAHRAVVNFLNSMRQEPGLTEQDVLLAVTTISFDIAALELYLPLIVGARIVLVSREVASNAAELLKTLVKSGATVMQGTPATWRLLLAAGWQGNKQLKILCGGEPLTRELANQLQELSNCVWNMYGPTETTTYSVIYKVEPGNSRVPIGRPIANTQIYLIDQYLRRKGDPIKPVPIGVAGEVLIGGVGLARGYLNRPELTNERFIPNPFSDEPGARLYKTGDLARYLPDGNIEFIERIDHQVKIRGFRIELGEIEAALSQHPAVRETVVLARGYKPGDDKRLVAYVVPQMQVTESHAEQTKQWQKIWNEDTSNLVPQLRVFLKENLPDYMVPSAFVIMDTLPLMPNGKVDRRALPAPNRARPVLHEAFVAPCTVVEKRLAEIWAAVLGIESVGIHDNFFELGGHSLLTAQMLSVLQKTFQVELPLRSLFEAPTVAGLAQAINTYDSACATTIDNITVPDLNAEAVLDPRICPDQLLCIQFASPSNRGGDREMGRWGDVRLRSGKEVFSPSPTPPLSHSRQSCEHIFLTGATGFIGAFLLHELLGQTKANIYCLVRSSSPESGKQKIRRNLERYLLWNEELDSRIIPVLGELSQPFLGLGEQQFRELATILDFIYHNGAFVNLIYPYSALRATNVLGTQEILRLASIVKVKPVHFISTLDVFQSSHYLGMKVIQEQDALEHSEGLHDGYAQSKWVAEKLVMTARSRGIPVCIYRLGMITGHSQTGVSKTDDLMCRIIKGFIQLGSAPDLDMMINLTPVDYVSKAIIYFSRQTESLGQAFHLVNPHSLHLSKLVNEIHSLGYPIEQMTYDKWQAELLNVDISQENALSPLVSLFTERISGKHLTYLETSSLGLQSFDCQNTVDGLAGTPIVCPPVDARLLSTYFSYFTRSGFLDTPQLYRQGSSASPLGMGGERGKSYLCTV